MDKGDCRPDNTVKCWCNQCRRDTVHFVLKEHAVRVKGMLVHGREMDRHEHYMVVECRGCEEIHFLKVRIGSEDIIWTIEYEHPFDCPLVQSNFPPRNIARKAPDWIQYLQCDLRDLMTQTYMVLHIGADRLVAMGARAVLERVMIEKCGDQGTFGENITEFVKQGFLAPSNREAVMAALDVGSAAVHRAYKPDLQAVVDVFEIVESVVHSVYIIPMSAARRIKNTPKRKTRAPSSAASS